MKVTLVDHTIDPVAKIGLYAGECYNARRDVESCLKRAAKCVEEGHLSTLRFAYATFHVEDVSRVCLAQITRHAHLSYLVKSQRYVDESAGDTVWPTSYVSLPEHLATRATLHEVAAFELYADLREAGVKKEDARFVLPQSVTTSLYITGNFQAWSDFLRLRTDKHAQEEVRTVALEIKRHLAQIAPQLFGDKA